MSEVSVLASGDLKVGAKKVVSAGDADVLLINDNGVIYGVQANCPHAGAPLIEGAVCNGKLVCPWHLATFALPTGELLEPTAMEPLKTYPVRIQDGQIWVSTETNSSSDTLNPQSEEKPVFVLIGSGAAGSMAAVTLRQQGFAGKIIAIDPVHSEPVDRTQLSKDALGGKMPLNEIVLDVLPGADVERINAAVVDFSSAKREVRLESGVIIKFDKALVATGGTPKRLSIPGAELAYTIRHSEDVRQLLKAIEGNKSVVIVGTSFIGLEAASALVQNGARVTVVGPEILPFEKQFGAEVAKLLKDLHADNGTKFHLGVEVVSISAKDVTVSKDGKEEQLPADVVIMGVGVIANLSFSHDLKVAEKGGIVTDQSLRVNDNVWVAGDIASVNGQRIEHWRVAQQHGRTAALAMLGKPAVHTGVPFFWTYHFEKSFGYLGHSTQWDKTVVKGNLQGPEFLVFYVKGDQVQAVLNFGFQTAMASLAEPMENGLTLQAAIDVFGRNESKSQ